MWRDDAKEMHSFFLIVCLFSFSKYRNTLRKWGNYCYLLNSKYHSKIYVFNAFVRQVEGRGEAEVKGRKRGKERKSSFPANTDTPNLLGGGDKQQSTHLFSQFAPFSWVWASWFCFVLFFFLPTTEGKI